MNRQKKLKYPFIFLSVLFLFSLAVEVQAGSLDWNGTLKPWATLGTLSQDQYSRHCNDTVNVTPVTIAETTHTYISSAWRGGTITWKNAAVGWSVTSNNGGVLVNESNGEPYCADWGPGQLGVASIGVWTFFNGSPADNDSLTFNAQALRKNTKGEADWYGTVDFGVNTVTCFSGQLVQSGACVNTNGTLTVAPGNSGQTGGNSLSCTAPCSPDVHWRTIAGLDGYLTRDGVTISSSKNGDLYDSGANFSVGRHTYGLWIKDGFNNYPPGPNKIATVDVTAPTAPTAGFTVSSSLNLNSSRTSGPATISNVGATKGGSFQIHCDFLADSSTFPSDVRVTVSDCYGSVGPDSSKTVTISLSDNMQSYGGSYSAKIRVFATGENSTVITSDNPQYLTVNYTTTPSPPCPPGQTGTPPNCVIPPPPPPGPTALSCSPASQTKYFPDNPYSFSFNATGGNGTYSWSNNASWVPRTSGGSSYNISGYGRISNGTATVTSGAQTATCCFSAGISPNCNEPEPPPPPPPSRLTIATDGHYRNIDCGLGRDEEGNQLYCQVLDGNWQGSLSGTAPFNGIDLRYSFGRSSLFDGDYVRFNCGNGAAPVDVRTSNSSDLVSFNQCNYSTPGTYTLTGVVYGCSTTPGGCITGSGSASVTVTMPVDFTFTQAAWTIPSGTPRYRADYDYNNDGVLDKLDSDQLAIWAGNRTACPSGKTCDINGNGIFNTDDALAYIIYLQTLDMYKGGANQNATMYFSSSSGATVAMSATGGPTGSSYSPTSVTIPPNSRATTLFTVLGVSPLGTYTIASSGTVGSSTKSSNLTLNILPGDPTASGGGGPQVIQPNYCTSGPAATVSWIYSDPNGVPQASYQVQIDDNQSFSNPKVDSGQVNSSNTSYSSGPGRLQFNTTYRARVRVWNTRGAVSAWAVSNSWTTPKHAYPQPNFSWSPFNPAPRQAVQFTDQTTFFDGGGGGRAWAWTFGDGKTANTQNPSHIYATSGNYTVNLTATDKDGYTCAFSPPPGQTITVKNPIPTYKEVSPKP